MGQLTTHVLDTSAGVPAAGVRIELRSLAPNGAPPADDEPLVWVTGKDGRCAAPLLAGDALTAGRYALVFFVGEYFRGRGVSLPAPAFIEEAVIHIGIANPGEHYHVPLLVSPWSYSVYRGG